MPGASTSWYVRVQKNSANYVTVWIESIGNPGNRTYIKHKDNGTWNSNWVQLPTRAELTPQFIQNITLSNTGAGDTGISSVDYYITQPVVTNKADIYCYTFITSGHWYIRALNRIDNSVATGPVNIRLLKIPV